MSKITYARRRPRARQRITASEFVREHRARGCDVDASLASFPFCLTEYLVFSLGQVLPYEPDGGQENDE